MRVLQSGTHFSAESTEARLVKYPPQGHNTLMQPWIKLLICMSTQ